MEIFVRFVVAFAGFFFLTRLLTRKHTQQLSKVELLLAFSAKVAMGCIYGWVFLKWYGGDDTWYFNQDSMAELDKLKNRTLYFFEDINPFLHARNLGWSKGLAHFREKLELALIIKPLAIFNFFSNGNYYLNVIAFSFIGFWGHYWLYRFLLPYWSQKKVLLFAIVFLFPPSLFWLSGIRTDSWLFFFFSLLLYSFDQLLQKKKRVAALVCLLAFSGMIICRSAFAGLTVPILVSWWLVKQHGFPARKAFLYSLGVLTLIFLASSYFPSPFNLPMYLVKIQEGFMELTGNTRVELGKLEPTPLSFIQNAPKALGNAWLEPLPHLAKGVLQKLSFIDNVLLIVLLLLAILGVFNNKGNNKPTHPIWMGLAIYAFLGYLLIGYTIPFPGASARYKAIVELCWVVWAFNMIRWKNLFRL
ncbi:hypothetical protein KJS94_07695 [Flavihumibacter rivuli]|uniref:hypothetical protein n=1 Tax=Flavihumibacter rivuli TaxID=2838156 RepID=UPI001BDE1948|nr:hypothetical protein [Flavihumibacter rivuli]ULQ58084.1 hypothetical protein KJS94_07695 [Flavihumibacter rivuli]